MSHSSRVLVAFVDALGPDQLDRLTPALGFATHRRSLHGILGYSSGALPTILTGAPPAVHGRMCLFSARDQQAEAGILTPLRWLGLLPRIVHERGAVRRRIARLLASYHGLDGYLALHRVPPEEFSWLDIPEREDLFQASTIGGTPTFLAQAREAGLSVYAMPWQLPEADRWRHAHTALQEKHPDLAFLYCAELDAALHREGNASAGEADALRRIGAELERARAAMGRDGAQVTTWIIGDHGMADVTQTIDPRPVLRALDGVRLFVDSTMLRIWGDDGVLERARRLVHEAGWPGQWLDEDALRARQAPVEGHPYGRAMFVLDEGVIFAPSWLGGAVAGMHGYDPGGHSARAALASDAPIDEGFASIADLAPRVRERLDLIP